MAVSTSLRCFRRCFSTANCVQLPRTPPKPSPKLPNPANSKPPSEYVTWRPPTHTESPLSESKEKNKIHNAPRHVERQGGGPSSLGTQKPDADIRNRPHRETSNFPPLHRDEVSLRWETFPPTPEQLKSTERFFLQHPPQFLWSADKFKTIDYGNVPEV